MEDTREPGKGPRAGSLARSSSLNTDVNELGLPGPGQESPQPTLSFLGLALIPLASASFSFLLSFV